MDLLLSFSYAVIEKGLWGDGFGLGGAWGDLLKVAAFSKIVSVTFCCSTNFLLKSLART